MYGPERINEIPEPLPDEFLRPTPPTDRVPPMDPTSGMKDYMNAV